VDYDLPNDSNYSETCASIGLALFGIRMSRITREAFYIDTVERALYNTIRGGISIQGDRYFYVNPLEVWPPACLDHTSRSHVEPVRQKWFDVACCPTNIARTFTSLGQYIYAAGEDELYLNLFIQNDAAFEIKSKIEIKNKIEIKSKTVELSLKTDYPRTGSLKVKVKAQNVFFALLIRIPGFAENFKVTVNAKDIDGNIIGGYYRINRAWNDDEVGVTFTIRPRLAYANPLVRANVGKAAIVRGPEVYCLEETDNGPDLAALYIDPAAELREEWREDILGGVMVIRCRGKKLVSPGLTESFSCDTRPKFKNIELTAVPYGSWCNRHPGEMLVWIHTLV
jgi:DUF1680 family protein